MPRAERERLHAKKTFLVQQEELVNITNTLLYHSCVLLVFLQLFILSPRFIFSIPAISALSLLLSHSPRFSPLLYFSHRLAITYPSPSERPGRVVDARGGPKGVKAES